MLRASTSAPSSGLGPPLYWKVPGSDRQDRDYVVENKKHVRHVSSEVKKSKSREKLEPMKVKFIPGLTKNPNYDHVESRISGLIKGTLKYLPRDATTNTNSSTSVNCKGADDMKPIWGGSSAANARRSKNTSRSSNTPVLRRKPAALKPQYESVYNWRFSDSNNVSPTFTEQERLSNPDKFAQFKTAKDLHLHRVEYLPCDGICADEPVFHRNGDNGSGDGGSGRSSRGINTEETRIFGSNFGNLRSSQSLTRLENSDVGDSVRYAGPERFIATVHEQTEKLNQHHLPQRQRHNSHEYPSSSHHPGYRDEKNSTSVKETPVVDPFVERIKQNMAGMQLNMAPRQGFDAQAHGDFTNRNAGTSSTCSHTPPRRNGFPDSPHKTGVIPKYLKKRQQQWKEEAVAKQEAEKAASIPAGHVAMSEAERLENLANLQRTYDNLVNELNRVPIRIDTIRVREYKQHLEQELSKLEQAMRLFSRPTLYVKVDNRQ